MNTSIFRDALIDIAKSEGSNLTSKLIAFYYPSLDFSSRNNLFESLLNRLMLTKENHDFNFDKLKQEINDDIEVINIEDYEGKDYRIKEIEISNLRGIPQVDDKNQIPYGISLIDDKNEINNAIILANNGVGKSSLFAGLEMIYAQEIGEKKLRTLNPNSLKNEDFENYLNNIRNSQKPHCEVKTIDGNFNLDKKVFKNNNVLKLLNPQAHFISEYDIIRNGQTLFAGKGENTIHSIIADALGLSEFLDCLQVTEQIPNYRRSKETTTRNGIRSELEENNKIIENNPSLIQTKLKHLSELKEERKGLRNEDLSDQIKKLNRLLNKASNLNLDQGKNILYTLKNYRSSFDRYSSININRKTSIEKEFLEAGTKLLHDFDNCPYCRNSNLSLEEIKLNVEKRLEELNALSNLSEQINKSYKNATDELFETFHKYNTFYNLIQEDRSDLSSYPDLNPLSEEENRLYAKLAPIVNDDDLNKYIKDLSQKTIPNDNDFKSFTNLLNNNPVLFEDFLSKTNDEISELLTKRNRAIENKIEKISTQNSSLNKEQEIKNLENEIKELEEQIERAKSRNEGLEKDLIKANNAVNQVNKLKSEITYFNNKLRLQLNLIVESSFKAFKEPVEEILNNYFIDDSNFELKIKLKDYSLEIDGEKYTSRIIVAEIADRSNPNIVASPDQYFNTFRYKLFSLMIGLSIALSSRKKYKVNLPLVIDDLFYGSDYVSKNTFSKFIKDLIILFYNHTPNMPLQIILFTHDNFIYKSALEGIEYLSISKKGYNLDNTLKSRMFHPSDKEKNESISGFKYWNLINS